MPDKYIKMRGEMDCHGLNCLMVYIHYNECAGYMPIVIVSYTLRIYVFFALYKLGNNGRGVGGGVGGVGLHWRSECESFFPFITK